MLTQIHYTYHICTAFSNIRLSRLWTHTCTVAEISPCNNHNSAAKRDNQSSSSCLIQYHPSGALLSHLTPPPTHSQPPWRNSRPGGCWSYTEYWDLEKTGKMDCYREDKAFLLQRWLNTRPTEAGTTLIYSLPAKSTYYQIWPGFLSDQTVWSDQISSDSYQNQTRIVKKVSKPCMSISVFSKILHDQLWCSTFILWYALYIYYSDVQV